jgi:P27 family predicted phage terminase small subunit
VDIPHKMPLGRRRKRAAQREAEGNPGHRLIPVELDFAAAGEIGKPPTWLDKDAKREFKRITAALADLDMLRATDVGVLASYSVAYSRWIAAEKRIAAEGTVLKVVGSQGQEKFVKHPALLVSSEAQKQMLRAGSLLGLNPVDRNKISATPKQLSNPFAALLDNDEETAPD